MTDLRDRRAFCRVAELASFSAAARDLGLPVATVSAGVRRLEEGLGLRLLERTTRRVSTTEAGQAYYDRIAPILDDLADADAQSVLEAGDIAGHVRITAPSHLARALLVPRLNDLTRRHPALRLDFALGDRVADLVEERVDIALRIGPLPDSSLTATRLGAFEQIVCAAPSWTSAQGPVRSPADLPDPLSIAYRFPGAARGYPWALARGDERVNLMPGGAVTFDDLDAYVALGIAGLGPVCVLSFQADDALRRGALERLLPDWTGAEVDIHALTPERRLRPRRVTAVLDWLRDCVGSR